MVKVICDHCGKTIKLELNKSNPSITGVKGFYMGYEINLSETVEHLDLCESCVIQFEHKLLSTHRKFFEECGEIWENV